MTFAKWTLGGAAFFAVVALTAPASAQTQAASGASNEGGLGSMTGINLGGSGPDEATVEKRREIEEAYKKATKSQPAAQTTAVNDPWANMRGNEPPKAAAHPAPKTAQKKKPAQ